MEMLHYLQEEVPIREIVIGSQNGRAVLPVERVYTIECGTARHSVVFQFHGQRWIGLKIDDSVVDLENAAPLGFSQGELS